MASPMRDMDPIEAVEFHEKRLQDYDMREARGAFISYVEAGGYIVVEPAPNQLQIDIDTPEQYETFKTMSDCLSRNWDAVSQLAVPTIEEHFSKSGFPRRHITVTLPFNVEPWQRIAFQAAMGSDPFRELLSIVRLLRGDDKPTLFVEEKKVN